MENNWIPVSKSAPETSGDYLVSCKGGAVKIDFYYGPDFEVKRGWEERLGYEAVAWQPLPKAYEVE